MVSVAIFAVIMVVGVGAMVSMTGNYRIARNNKEVHDSLNYALELMAREIRLGTEFEAGATNPASISKDDGSNEDTFGFITSGQFRGYVMYGVDSGALYLNRAGAHDPTHEGISYLTDPDLVVIDDISFTVTGTDSVGDGDYRQPIVWIKIQAYSPANPDLISNVQTLISQRAIDA